MTIRFIKDNLCALAKYDEYFVDQVELEPYPPLLSPLASPRGIAILTVTYLYRECPPRELLHPKTAVERVLKAIELPLSFGAPPRKAAEEVVLQHPLPDGNKRAGFLVNLFAGGSAEDYCEVLREELGVPCKVKKRENEIRRFKLW